MGSTDAVDADSDGKPVTLKELSIVEGQERGVRRDGEADRNLATLSKFNAPNDTADS